MSNSKEALRREARARLAGMPKEERLSAGAAIEAAIWAAPEVKSAETILLYASMGSEVPTDSIALEARRRGIRLAYPRCLPGSYVMALHEVSGATEFVTGAAYGIREPDPNAPAVAIAEVDLALLPGLAWDRTGGRLGRGAGYYDRMLAHPAWRAIRCGLFFSIQELERIPRDPWDIPMDLVTTELELVRF